MQNILTARNDEYPIPVIMPYKIINTAAKIPDPQKPKLAFRSNRYNVMPITAICSPDIARICEIPAVR